jgi:hypothetical protein
MCITYVYHVCVSRICITYLHNVCISRICITYLCHVCVSRICITYVYHVCVSRICIMYLYHVVHVSRICITYVYHDARFRECKVCWEHYLSFHVRGVMCSGWYTPDPHAATVDNCNTVVLRLLSQNNYSSVTCLEPGGDSLPHVAIILLTNTILRTCGISHYRAGHLRRKAKYSEMTQCGLMKIKRLLWRILQPSFWRRDDSKMMVVGSTEKWVNIYQATPCHIQNDRDYA